jgi:signal transduction histidine kinase
MLSGSISADVLALWLSLAVIVFLEAIAFYSWQFRREPGARWFSAEVACAGAWLLALAFAAHTPDFAQMLIWNKLCAILGLLAIYLWFRFIAELSGFDRTAPAWLLKTMLGILCFFLLLMLADHGHGWIWSSVQRQGSTILERFAPAGYLSISFAYLTNAFSVFINVRWALRCVGLRRRQAWFFLMPNLFGWVAQFLSFYPHSAIADPHTIGFFAYGLCLTWAFYRWRIYSVLPLARDVLLSTMQDGLMVIDDAGYIVELNQAAREIVQGLPVAVGTRWADAKSAWPALAGSDSTSPSETIEVDREFAGHLRLFQVRQRMLRIPGGQNLGRILVFREVTLERQQQAQILEQQKALSALTERQRLGRELHDGQGQIWSFLSMQAQAARTLLAKREIAPADHRLERMLQVMRDVHVDLRESISSLQTGIDTENGLMSALEEQLEWYRRHCELHAELELRCDWQPRMLSPLAAAQALRIVQEALANVRKSAQAGRVRVIVEREGEQLKITVEDDGCGFDPTDALAQSGHHGLRIMRERAEEIGARLEVDSQPGCGTRIKLFLSLMQ